MISTGKPTSIKGTVDIQTTPMNLLRCCNRLIDRARLYTLNLLGGSGEGVGLDLLVTPPN